MDLKFSLEELDEAIARLDKIGRCETSSAKAFFGALENPPSMTPEFKQEIKVSTETARRILERITSAIRKEEFSVQIKMDGSS